MKNVIRLSLLSALLWMALPEAALAQRGDNVDKYFNESEGFTHRLWYGGGLTLGFNGNSFSSLFQIGISPLVGYKITNEFSIGPRFSLLYNHYRNNTTGQTASANLFYYGIGAFTRYKIIRNFFIHLEYGADNIEVIDGIIGDDVATSRIIQSNAYVGAGYNDGNGVWGYDIYVLYNVLLPESSIQNPIDFRFGLTYNF